MLLRAQTVRTRAHLLLAKAKKGELSRWRYDPAAMPAIADEVAATIRTAYPALDIPFHARWRHFVVGGVDRAARYKTDCGPMTGRAAFDLAIVSVLLDAGAGALWSYRTADGLTLNRSEGLAIASLDMFEAGAFSSQADDPCRADAAALQALTVADLERAFQVSPQNPLIGLEGRVDLLNALGRACAARPNVFALCDGPRPGGLFDALVMQATDDELAAPPILEAVLENLGPIWPSRITLDGVSLGDCWHHSGLDDLEEAPGLMPFHKLSQWLAYSLIEPLQWAGLSVASVNSLTGLPEYRNGGLFVDGGALTPCDLQAVDQAWSAGDEFIVEWRALTVALLDELAGLVRETFGKSETEWPLATILEGGTWATGRRLARARRPGGAPPINITSDGTVF